MKLFENLSGLAEKGKKVKNGLEASAALVGACVAVAGLVEAFRNAPEDEHRFARYGRAASALGQAAGVGVTAAIMLLPESEPAGAPAEGELPAPDTEQAVPALPEPQVFAPAQVPVNA